MVRRFFGIRWGGAGRGLAEKGFEKRAGKEGLGRKLGQT